MAVLFLRHWRLFKCCLYLGTSQTCSERVDIDIQLLELGLTDRNLNESCGMEKSPIKPFVGLAPSTPPVMDKTVQDFQHISEYKDAPEMEYNVPVEVSSCLCHAEFLTGPFALRR